MVDLGLSADEAFQRLRTDGPNELPAARPRRLPDIAIDVVREPMLLLLIATGFVYLLLGDFEEALALVAAIAVVVGITLYQTHKTERALQALRDLSSPRALVIRGGETIRIAGRDVVRGDLIVLHEGDRVPADATIESCANLSIDESLLTGESAPVRKAAGSTANATGPPGGDDRPFVYSGTLVVRGTGIAQVSATGVRTEFGKIGVALSRLEAGRTSLQVEVGKMVRILAVLGLTVCALIAVTYGLTRHQWLDGALAGLTIAISMVPEEFPVVLTIFLALGAWRISRNRVLTRRVPAIETLGSATVLCVDKTGTLTMNRMSVSAIAAGDEIAEVTAETRCLAPTHTMVVEAANLASRSDPFDPMERAFIDLGSRLGLDASHARWTMVREYPLSDRLLAVTQVWKEPERPGFLVATKGAPEDIARLCRLDDQRSRALLDHTSAMARRGLRVLGVASCRHLSTVLPDAPSDFPFTVLGLAGLSDPVRPGVPDAIDECRSAGVRVVMITGDYPETAVNIAAQIGLPNAGAVLTGADVDRLSDDELQRRAADVNVFARMVPDQKLRLVMALKAGGEIVAMTGDGVNDAPALKAAHIGIAMGDRGTDVAREAAALVLLDDDFSSIVRAIRLGRRIYDNITKAMAYVFGIHVPIAGLAVVPVLFGGPLVLLPLHVILMELIVDPACSVAFEMEPAEADVMQRPPRNPRQRLFTPRLMARSAAQGAGAGGIALVVFFGALRSGLGDLDVRTLTFATLVIANLALIFANRSLTRPALSDWRTPNPALWLLAGGTLAVLAAILYVPFLRDLFRLAMPHVDDSIVFVTAGLASLAWMEAVKRLARKS